ncbi:MAG: PAS domain-containing protein [Bacteroidetes bacterium]|nr:PAS domain-containing protein [Bacteroidota bacterium]
MPEKHPVINILMAAGSKPDSIAVSNFIKKSKLPVSINIAISALQVKQSLKKNSPDLLIISPYFKMAVSGAFITQLKKSHPLLPIIAIESKKNKIPAAVKKIADDVLEEEGLTPTILKKNITHILQSQKTNLELKEALERNELLTKATNNIVWDWDINKRFAYWMGNGLKEILGYDKIQMYISTDFWDNNLHPEDKERVMSRLLHIFKEAKASKWEEEYRFKNKKGGYVYIYDRGYIIYKDGRPVRMIGSMENITEKKLSEANYKNLFDKNPVATFIWSIKKFKILDVNEAALNEYGYTKKEFLDLNIFDLRPKAEIEKFKDEALKDINKGYVYNENTWVHKNKKAENMLMQISSYKINYKGEPARMALAKNITEEINLFKKLEKEKNLKNKHIAEAVIIAQEKERTEIGKELHDNVNQLLSASKLYIEAAKNDQQESHTLLSQASEYIMSAIEEIRMLSKALNTPILNEVGLIETTENLAEDLMKVNKIKIEISSNLFYETGLQENFKLALFRIIQEQVTNILKHAKATKAKLTFIRNKTLISLEIRDNGVGFEKNKKGKGIGLANMKSRAEIYKGEMNITSSRQKGTVLSLEFPLEYCLDENELL